MDTANNAKTKPIRKYRRKAKPYRFKDEDLYYIAVDQGATCCADKHPTYYGTVTSSPYWEKWNEENYRRFHEFSVAYGNTPWREQENFDMTPFGKFFDVDECVECGVIGKEHFNEFLHYAAQLINEEKQDIKK